MQGLAPVILTLNTNRPARSWWRNRTAVFEKAELVVKVKEPRPPRYHCWPGQILFTYLHLAAEPSVDGSVDEIGRDGAGLRNH